MANPTGRGPFQITQKVTVNISRATLLQELLELHDTHLAQEIIEAVIGSHALTPCALQKALHSKSPSRTTMMNHRNCIHVYHAKVDAAIRGDTP